MRQCMGYPLTVGARFGVERAALLGLLHIAIPKQLLDFLKLYLVDSYSLSRPGILHTITPAMLGGVPAAHTIQIKFHRRRNRGARGATAPPLFTDL